MSIKLIAILSVGASLLMAEGCSHAPLSNNFDQANSSNITAQIVNPSAGRDEPSLATLDGQKSERLLDRYRTDTGKAPREVLVTNVGK